MATQRLVAHGHHMAEIGEYPITRVASLLVAIDRIEARDRMAFVSDMSVVVGGMFGSGDALTKHIDDLKDESKG